MSSVFVKEWKCVCAYKHTHIYTYLPAAYDFILLNTGQSFVEKGKYVHLALI